MLRDWRNGFQGSHGGRITTINNATTSTYCLRYSAMTIQKQVKVVERGQVLLIFCSSIRILLYLTAI